MQDGELEYEVERVMDHRHKHVGGGGTRSGTKRKPRVVTEFLVKWKGYGHEHNTWEPEANCANCPEAIQTYWDERQTRAEARVALLKVKSRKRKRK